MKLEDIDTSKCKIDPKGDLMQQIRKHKPFNRKLSYRISVKKVLTYIILLYDVNSPLLREVRRLPERKAVAMEMAGMTVDDKNGKFDRPVELMMMGKHQDINAMIIYYIFLQGNPEWAELVSYEAMFYMETARVMNGIVGKASETIKNLAVLSKKIEELTQKIVGGEGEAPDILAEIYKQSTKGLDVSPERISNFIEEQGDVPDNWNPYSEWVKKPTGKMVLEEIYEVEKSKFISDH